MLCYTLKGKKVKKTLALSGTSYILRGLYIKKVNF